jgi:hypothetical protein
MEPQTYDMHKEQVMETLLKNSHLLMRAKTAYCCSSACRLGLYALDTE